MLTFSVACDTGISFDLSSEIKKKWNLKGKKRELIKALEVDLTDKKKGMAQDEIAKKIKGKRTKKPNLINHSLLLYVLILHQVLRHPKIQI